MSHVAEEDPFLRERNGKDDHGIMAPHLWAALGVAYVILGLVQFFLATFYRWWLGAALGFGLAKMGTTLIGIGVTGGRQPPLPPGSSFGARMRHMAGAIVLWGSTKFQKLFYALRWPVLGYGVFVVLLITIRLNSPDPIMDAFPESCGGNHLGCSRVAEHHPQAPKGLEPLYLSSSLNVTQAAVEAWINDQVGARVLASSPGFVHARVVTPVWGFADDFMVSLRCSGDSEKALVEAQGQLRIGKSDLGVNGRRNRQFFTWLAQKPLPAGSCS